MTINVCARPATLASTAASVSECLRWNISVKCPGVTLSIKMRYYEECYIKKNANCRHAYITNWVMLM